MKRPAGDGAPSAFFPAIGAERRRLLVLYATAGADVEAVAERLGLAALLYDADRAQLPRASLSLDLERRFLAAVGDLRDGLLLVAVYLQREHRSLGENLVRLYAFAQPRFQALVEYMRYDVRLSRRKEELLASAPRRHGDPAGP